MRIAYIGRFAAGWATERDMAEALGRQGHDVIVLEEQDSSTWAMLANKAARRPLDLVVWTTARLSAGVTCEAIDELRSDKPVVAYHLDRWWGLRREAEIAGSPFFHASLVVTADGGHDAEWEQAGIRHRWLPPAVSRDEIALEGERQPALDTDVLFVGNWWQYHPEWQHRRQLVEHLQRWFGKRFAALPHRGGQPVRGPWLANAIRSAQVVVGDSCLAGGAQRYWSDRIPETLGRGGFLLHPEVAGLEEHYKVDEHLVTWPACDWRALREALEHWLAAPDDRRRIAAAGREHVLAHHTYDVRAAQLLAICTEEGLL